MPRSKRHVPLRVLLNDNLVGMLSKHSGGAIAFQYDESWLDRKSATPVSLSMPLREDAYRGEPVVAVFENLLPDSEALRRKIAERVGAESSDAYGLLSVIGRDCVGALQFVKVDEEKPALDPNAAEPLDDLSVEKLLKSLAQAPLGLSRDEDFRISIAGAQEKTALLRDGKRWCKPLGTTPTTHILKPSIGQLPNGIDLSNSVENEFYCMKLLAAFGLEVAEVQIETFGATKALVVTRFDRTRTRDGYLRRLPQEDFCQALSVTPSRKYQSDGGPGIVSILDVLRGSDKAEADRRAVFKAQVIFWLIGATDGHAKNFSVFLGPGGSFRLAPFYDVLTTEPSFRAGEASRNQLRLAMAVGATNHYRIATISRRHFVETALAAGISGKAAAMAMDEVAETSERALEDVGHVLRPGFPPAIPDAVNAAVRERVRILSVN